MRVEHKREQAHHHALFGFGRVLGNGQAVLCIIMTIHIGDGDFGFVDGGFECHSFAFEFYSRGRF